MKYGSRAPFFSPGSRQEVNSTWYPEIEEPIKSREKHYSLLLYILIRSIHPSIDFCTFVHPFIIHPFHRSVRPFCISSFVHSIHIRPSIHTLIHWSFLQTIHPSVRLPCIPPDWLTGSSSSLPVHGWHRTGVIRPQGNTRGRGRQGERPPAQTRLQDTPRYACVWSDVSTHHNISNPPFRLLVPKPHTRYFGSNIVFKAWSVRKKVTFQTRRTIRLRLPRYRAVVTNAIQRKLRQKSRWPTKV